MKINKTVTEEVLQANQKNSKQSTGPRTAEGKRRSSRNSLKHGILARTVQFRDEADERTFGLFLSDLQRDLAPRDAVDQILVEELAAACHRRGRANEWAQSLCEEGSPGTTMLGQAIAANQEMLGRDLPTSYGRSGWDCSALSINAKKETDPGDRISAQAGRQIEIRATFENQLNTAMRYAEAAMRDMYQAIDRLLKRPRPGMRQR
jgi:hypothetical protein